MEIKEITNKEEWERFLEPIPKEEKTFLHSFQWGQFQLLLKEKIYRLGIYENNVLMAVALVIKVKAKRGNFLLIPHGPIIQVQSSKFKVQSLGFLINFLKVLAKQEKCCFIRVATTFERTKENENIFKEFGFKQAPFHTHPDLTWLLDISKPEEDLLKEMRKTTRYLIKQGLQIPELKIEKSVEKRDVKVFNKFYQETASRHDFTPFSLNYLNKELEAFLPDNILVLKAVFNGEALASSFIIFWGGVGFYHQGASTHKHPKVPATYLMQWQAIREAKQRGCSLYNFWGIADLSSKFKVKSSKLKKHPWAGLSLFKMGFGGYAKEYLKTQDLPLSKRYYLTRYFEFLRKWKRHL
ncbi:peptidoglycan bridge formation glycyltransferase FemA/FemB family protein [Candidatus Parcubacteria bacterium]|nr:peptidoglycan bridge formation glycyltransferase FemA/FemB family protein [Candidatus Parcubacteria bacterium]